MKFKTPDGKILEGTPVEEESKLVKCNECGKAFYVKTPPKKCPYCSKVAKFIFQPKPSEECIEHTPELYDVCHWHCKVCKKELVIVTLDELNKLSSSKPDRKKIDRKAALRYLKRTQATFNTSKTQDYRNIVKEITRFFEEEL